MATSNSVPVFNPPCNCFGIAFARSFKFCPMAFNPFGTPLSNTFCMASSDMDNINCPALVLGLTIALILAGVPAPAIANELMAVIPIASL